MRTTLSLLLAAAGHDLFLPKMEHFLLGL